MSNLVNRALVLIADNDYSHQHSSQRINGSTIFADNANLIRDLLADRRETALKHIAAVKRAREDAHRLGCRDGLIHALCAIGRLRGAITGPANAYFPPAHHTVKRANVEMRLAELEKAQASIQYMLDPILAIITKDTLK